MENLILSPRPLYLQKILNALARQKLVFVVGVRRSGKSCIAAQLEQALREGSEKPQVLRVNYEKMNVLDDTSDELSELAVSAQNHPLTYILLDEISHINDWEQTVNRLLSAENVKVVLFSSNQRVISEELIGVKENLYEVVHALPLSLDEFIQFQNFTEITDRDAPLAKKLYRRFDGETYTLNDVYKYYIVYGGLPILKPEYMDRERARVIMDGTYSVIVMRDILEYGNQNGISAIADPVLLRCVITIMAKSIGDNISATWVGKQTAELLGRTSSTKTIESYMRSLLNANLFYMAERYDIHADKPLKTLAKYYVADAGLHNYLTHINASDESRLLENKVFFELIRRDYQVYNGKLGREEITLIAMRGDNKVYFQVATGKNLERKLAALRKIRDNHPKVVISYHSDSYKTKDGIHIVNALSFFMGASF